MITKSPLLLFLSAILLTLSGSTAFATSGTWSGATSANWSDTGNWSASPVPTAADTATFNATISNGNGTTNPVVIDSGRAVKSITFDTAAASSYVIGATGGNALSLTAGGTISNTATVVNAQTVNAPLILLGSYTFTNSSTTAAASLNFGGSIVGSATVGNNSVITLNGANTGTNTISGVVGNGSGGGTLGITVSGSTWVLTNTNTFSGASTMSAGTLLLGNNSALGTSAITISAGTLAASTTLSGVANVITDTGTVTVGGTNAITLSGNFTNSGGNRALTITNTAATTLTGGNIFLSEATGTGRTLTISVTGTGNATIGDVIADFNGSGTAGNLTVSGTNGFGTLTLSNANTYSGTTTLSSGTLILGTNTSLGTSAATISGGVLAASTTLSGVANAITDTGTVTIGGTNNITLSGNFTNSANNRTLTVNNTGSTALTGGSVFLSELSTAGRTLTVNGTGNATIGDVIADFSGSGLAGSLTYSGTGALTLSNANTYSGTTTVSSGTLIAGNVAALGTSAVALSGGTLDLATNTSINAYNVTVSGNTTIASDKATAGTGGITQTLGTLSIGTETLSVTAGPNVTGGAPVVAFGATTLLSTTGTTTIFNPTTANLALTTVTSLAAAGKTDTLDLDGTSSGNTVTGIISNGATGTLAVTKSNTGTWTLSSSANTYTGTTTVSGGTLATTLNASGNPFGTGAITITDGTLSFAPGSGASGNISDAGANAAAGTLLTYGDATILLNKGSANSLTVTLGGSTSALSRTGSGLLVIQTASTDLGAGAGTSGENLVFGGTAPTVTNGMVNATIVGLGVTTANLGDFLTYGANGFASASSAYTLHSTSFTPVANEIADVTGNATITTTNAVRGLLVQSGDTATLSGTQNFVSGGGIILNGGNINGGTINDNNGAEMDIYDFNAASTITSGINLANGGSGTPLVFGGNQTLTVSGPINENNHGSITVTSGGLTLTGSIGQVLGTTVNGGTLNLDAPYLATGNTLTVGGDITSGLTESVAKALTGGAALSVSGGTATLSQVNNNTGATSVSGNGTLNLTTAGADSNSSVTVSGGVLNASAANAITGTDSLSVTGGTANITTAQNYTGNTSLTGGSLVISAAGALGNTAVNLNGTVLTLSTANAINQNTLTWLNNSGLVETVNDAISGTAGLTVFTGGGTSTLSRANNYTGATTLNTGGVTNQGFQLDFSQAGAPTTNILNNGLAHGTGSTLVEQGGTLRLIGNPGAVNSQEFNGLSVNMGESTITTTQNGAAGLNLILNNISRTTGAIINFGLPTTGSFTTTTANANFTGGQQTILGGWALVGTNWAVSGSGATPGAITGLGTYVNATQGNLIQGTDVESDGSNTGTPASTVTSINSLRLGATGADFNLSQNLVIATGGILFAVTGTAAVDDNNASVGFNLTSGNGQDLITTVASQTGTLTIWDNITNNGSTPIGLTKSGSGTLVLNGANTFTGQLTINNGTVQLGSFAGAAESGQSALFFGNVGAGGGSLQLNGQSVTFTSLNDSPGDETITVNPGSIGISNTSATAATLTINNTTNSVYGGTLKDGTGGGALSLTKMGSGMLTITAGNENVGGTVSYTGATTIDGGKLFITGVAGRGLLSGTTSVLVQTGGSIGANNGSSSNFSVGNATTFTGMTVTGGSSAATRGSIDQVDGTAGDAISITATAGADSLIIGGATFSSGTPTANASGLNLESGDSVILGNTKINLQPGGLVVNLTGLGTFSGSAQTIISISGVASGFDTSTGGYASFTSAIAAGAITLGTTSGNFGGVTVTGFTQSTNSLQITESTNATPLAAFFSGAQGNTWNLFTNGNANNTDWVNADTGGADTLQQPAATTNVHFATAPLSGTPLTNYLNNTLGANYTINSLNFDSTAGTSAINISGNNTLTINAGTSGGNTSGNGITDSATGGTQTIATNLVTLGANQTWTVTNAADTLAVSSGVTDSANVFTLTKAGAGSLVFSSPNTYYGTTTVSAGKLYANSSTGSSTGFGSVAVNGGALSGTGTIAPLGANGITVADGGNLAPGGVQPVAGPGALVNGSLSINTGGIIGGSTILTGNKNTGTNAGLTFAIGAGSAGAGSTTSVSQLLVTGNVANIMNFNIGGTIGGAGTVISINDLVGSALTFTQIPGGTSDSTEYILIKGNGSTIYEDNGVQLGTGAATGDLGSSTPLGQQILGGLSLLAPTGGNTFSQQFLSARLFLDGDNIVLAVPEPSTWALMVGGLGLLVFLQRRKRNQS